MNSTQVFNPYLPPGEYIPDGEPYLFGDRVYIYGSHDRFGAPMFCMNDYVCWSAPADDLSNWHFDGVIFRKNQDPRNRLGFRLLFAPDIEIGPDGRYYLYYAYDFMGIMGVAVSDNPSGPFDYYGHVKHPDGTIWGRKKGDSFPFDPGIFRDDDGRIYLYSGFYTSVPSLITGGKRRFEGGYVLELEDDMVTIRVPEKLLFPKEGSGAFKGHEFFEASSMRKYNGIYYFIYSSRNNHELCYAYSRQPTGGFRFGGTLVSQGDLFLDGREDENNAVNYLGNTHGSILKLNGKYYIFYHRQTNQTSYARQACAEELVMRPDGMFCQAEVTSCGLNGSPLTGQGTYEARIACNLWSKNGTLRYDDRSKSKVLKSHPYFTQDEKDGDCNAVQYIRNIRSGSVAGFKYFEFQCLENISVTVRGNAVGLMGVYTDPECKKPVSAIKISLSGKEWRRFTGKADSITGKSALYFRYEGSGVLDFLNFSLCPGFVSETVNNEIYNNASN